jgi:CTP:molybdopterin cytidylyltransferase MocA
MTVGAILLAAGSARRMGEDKLLAELGGKPLVLHALDAIEAARLDGPIIAVRPGSAVIPLLEGRGRLVEIADHASGMGHSLAAAIRKAPLSWTAAIVCLGDMPFVRPLTLAALMREAGAKGIVRPTFEGRPGNPVLWGCSHFARLARLSGDQGGRALFERYPVELLECGDPGIEVDVDTAEALEKARERFA